jgi:tRNA(Ile)-lysidine synthase
LFRHASQLGENARILIAHTKDDMLETALMRVLRGAGPAGLSAMCKPPEAALYNKFPCTRRPKGGLPVKNGRIMRPMLSLSRADVIEYLKEKKIPWREDSTNADEKFLRNRIRHKLIPLLDESFPSWKSALTGMADTQSLAAAFLAEEAKQRVTWEQSSNTLTTNAETFFTCPQIIREEALFRGLNFYSKKISHKGTKARRTQRKLNGSEALTLNSSSVPFVSPCLCVNSSFDFHPAKRSTIRRFCNGAAASIDLGALYITQKDGKIIISPAHKGYSEKGFSLLIKEPGLYNLNNISVKVLQRQDTDKGFFACLPLVLRRSFKDDFLVCKGRKVKKRDLSAVRLISAVDAFGTAAFIEKQEVLFGRDLPVNDKEFYLVEIGGIDV